MSRGLSTERLKLIEELHALNHSRLKLNAAMELSIARIPITDTTTDREELFSDVNEAVDVLADVEKQMDIVRHKLQDVTWIELNTIYNR